MRPAVLPLLLLSVAPARAEPIVVAAGVETPVAAHHVVAGADCRFGVVPHVMVTRGPADGALRVRTEIARVPDDAPRCAGTMSRAAVIYYEPVGGYRGLDSFAYELVPDGGEVFDVTVEVK